MPSLSLLIKPVSGACNLQCRYCFYHDEQEHRAVASCGVMSEGTLETVIRKALAYATRTCAFGFQGGEPTLRGLDFFRRAVELQQRYNVHHARITNALQTNGLLIDEDWAAFLGENRFLVGLSLDGPKDLHDGNRVDAAGGGSYSRALRAAQLLKSRGVDVNVLTVVTGQVAAAIPRIYRFFRRSGLLYQQYIPCLDPLGVPRGTADYSLTPEAYGAFLRTLFDLWYRDVTQGQFVYIRYFENLVGLLLGRPPESCALFGECTVQHVVEADGSVYPCDFYCLDPWRLGTVQGDDFAALRETAAARRFVETSRAGREACRTCPYGPLCRGGCRRDREPPLPEGPGNYYCSAYRSFFQYALPRLRQVAAAVARGAGRG